jgi:hypothetical protein
MTAKRKTYKPLPGRSQSVVSYYRIYSADDHLLSVTSYGFQEQYKRFYFRDIQAIIIERTSRRRNANLIILALSVLCGMWWLVLMANWSRSSIGYAVVLSFFAVVCAVMALGNWILGPGCRCHIKTAVQTEQLNAIRRIGTAQKVLNRIQPLIAGAQAVAAATSNPATGLPPGNTSVDSPGVV